jgi:hypothetical protein
MAYIIPNTTTELLAFYGGTPVSQPTAAAQAAITDNSGGTAAPTTGVAAVAYKEVIIFPFGLMASLTNSTVYKRVIPYAFTVSSVLLRVGNPVTTGAKAATLTTQISGVACTGGVISAAGAYATGATQAGSAITALNTGAAGATLEFAVSAVTAFVEGDGWIEATVINTSRANADATMIAQQNAIRNALVTLGMIKGS